MLPRASSGTVGHPVAGAPGSRNLGAERQSSWRPGRLASLSNLGSVAATGAETVVQPTRTALDEVLADSAIPVGQQARGADALVAEQAPGRGLSSVLGWTRGKQSRRGRRDHCSRPANGKRAGSQSTLPSLTPQCCGHC
jgi:hypothetical protein